MKILQKTFATATMAAALTLGLNACMEQSPLNPQVSQSEVHDSGIKILKVKNPSLSKEFLQSQWIGSSGGTVWVGDWWHGISKLIIPEGAVNNWVLITFWWESTGFLEGGAEFSPHGIQFNEPVRIELSYKDADLDGIDEDDLKIYYFNEDTEEWEVIGDEVDKSKKVVIGYTNHFSRYAVGTD